MEINETKPNPLLQQPEYQPKASPEALKQQEESRKRTIEFQRICFEVFHANDNGKKLYDFIKEAHAQLCHIPSESEHCEKIALRQMWNFEGVHNLWLHGKIHLDRINGAK